MTPAHALKYHISEMGNTNVKKIDDTTKALIPQEKEQQEFQPKSTIAEIFSRKKIHINSVENNGTSSTGFRYFRLN
jgi:hypothetical protein